MSQREDQCWAIMGWGWAIMGWGWDGLGWRSWTLHYYFGSSDQIVALITSSIKFYEEFPQYSEYCLKWKQKFVILKNLGNVTDRIVNSITQKKFVVTKHAKSNIV